MKAYRCILSPHDFFSYVAKELKVGTPSDIISNTALLYALNAHVTDTQRNVSGNIPHYKEDMKKFPIYSTPAQILNKNLVITDGKLKQWDGVTREKKRITYNAIHTVNNITDSVQAVPSMGYYLKYLPFTPFECFVIGGRSSSLIRLGKKLPPVRVEYQPLKDITIKEDGIFFPSHPVNPKDLPSITETLECSVEVIPPVPIYRDAKLKGIHLKGSANGKEYCIAIPDTRIYGSVSMGQT